MVFESPTEDIQVRFLAISQAKASLDYAFFWDIESDQHL